MVHTLKILADWQCNPSIQRKAIANVQHICNLTGREEHNFGRITLSISILYSLTKKQKHSNFTVQKNRNLLLKKKLIVINQKLPL